MTESRIAVLEETNEYLRESIRQLRSELYQVRIEMEWGNEDTINELKAIIDRIAGGTSDDRE